MMLNKHGEKPKLQKNVVKAEAGKFPIVLDPFALEPMLTYTLVQLLGETSFLEKKAYS